MRKASQKSKGKKSSSVKEKLDLQYLYLHAIRENEIKWMRDHLEKRPSMIDSLIYELDLIG